jgi:hypothetical protein
LGSGFGHHIDRDLSRLQQHGPGTGGYDHRTREEVTPASGQGFKQEPSRAEPVFCIKKHHTNHNLVEQSIFNHWTRSYNLFKTLHSQLENNDEMRQHEALFEEAVIRDEFARVPALRKIVFLIDEHSKIAPAIYTCLEKIITRGFYSASSSPSSSAPAGVATVEPPFL